MNKLFKAIAILALGAALICGSAVTVSSTAIPSKVDPNVVYISGGVCYSDFFEFNEATMHLKAGDTLRLIIQTGGGDAYATVAICNRMIEMKKEGIHIITEVYGQAMSAGAFMFLMGDERIAHSGAQLMWHTIESQIRKFASDRGLWEIEQVIDMNTFRAMQRLDSFVRELFRSVTGMSDAGVDYWMEGTGDAAQYMSAKTAYNVGIATELK